ncbi:glycosyltransferase family 4 protein, partial [Candidatus Woesearchaeota archaeon]|nr:glycosyltransferase family 4 protein [Candidatus Woesearchaeota archaeon]
MRFLYLMEYYPPTVMGGAEISGQDLVERLAKKGHDVTVLTPNYRSFSTTIDRKENLTIIRYKTLRTFLFKTRKGTTQAAYSNNRPLFYWLIDKYSKLSACELRKRAKKLLKGNDFEVIGANNYESILALSKIKSPAKKVGHLRDFSMFCYDKGLYNDGKQCSGNPRGNNCCCMAGESFISHRLRSNMERNKKRFSKHLKNIDIFIA